MRYTISLAIVSLLLVIAGCRAGDDSVGPPNSQIVIRSGSSGATLSTPDSKGTVLIGVAQTGSVDVIRILNDGTGVTDEVDVTAEADFNLNNPSIASISSTGVITPLAVGTTDVNVKFRDEEDPDLDPTDTDSVDFVLTVTAGPQPTTP